MLVRITEKCDMGCNHCMVDAGPNRPHMTVNTYKSVLKFIKWTEIPLILISGGEPTQHPNVIEMITLAQSQGLKTVLLSNGTFLEDPKLTEEIKALKITVQITNDRRFYPRRIPIIEHPDFYYVDKIQVVSPIHRAKTNNLQVNRHSPLCFNFRSIARRIRNLKRTLLTLRMQGKMCTPSINIDGSIAAGESNFCSPIGTVYNLDEITIIDNIYGLTCNKCGLADQLDPIYRKAIGE